MHQKMVVLVAMLIAESNDFSVAAVMGKETLADMAPFEFGVGIFHPADIRLVKSVAFQDSSLPSISCP